MLAEFWSLKFFRNTTEELNLMHGYHIHTVNKPYENILTILSNILPAIPGCINKSKNIFVVNYIHVSPGLRMSSIHLLI